MWSTSSRRATGRTYKNHIEGYKPYLTGEQEKSPRRIYADKAWDEAQAKGWAIVDMKRDWRIIFPEPSEQPGDRP